MNTTNFVNVVSLALSVAAITLSVVISLRQIMIMRHANLLPVLIDMFREFREPEFKAHMSYVTTQLWEAYPPGQTGTSDLPEDARKHVGPVAGFFNMVGILVANKVVEDLLPASYMGRSVLVAWSRLAPYIYHERVRRSDENYYLFFENLVFLISRHGGPSKINARLKLKTVTVPPSVEGAPRIDNDTA